MGGPIRKMRRHLDQLDAKQWMRDAPPELKQALRDLAERSAFENLSEEEERRLLEKLLREFGVIGR